jgi:thiol-disulfide isomerase/thioredoxin
MATRRVPLSVLAVPAVVLSALSGTAWAQPKDAPTETKPADPAPAKPTEPTKDEKKPKKGRAPKLAKDAKEALDQARFAMQDWAWIQYDVKVEGVGISGEYTAKVTLEQAEAGGWKISVDGELKAKGSTKGRPIRVAYDGAAIRSIRSIDKEVGQLTDPADVEETMLFFAKERAAAAVAWEAITPPDGVPFAFADKAEVTLEPSAEAAGETCNIVRIVAKDAKPAGEGADAFGGVYAFSAKDGLIRRIERFKPNAKPTDKPLRTVTFTNVESSATVKGGEFALSIPSGYRVKTEAGKKALKPIEKAKEEAKKPAGKPGQLAVGDLATPFEAKLMDGSTVNFPGDYKGKIVMLDFWATWCGPCIGEMPNVVEAHKKFKDQGFEVLGISLDKKGDDSKIKQAEKKLEMSWPQVFDGGGWNAEIAKLYKVNSIPRTLLVDGDTGKVIDPGSGLRGNALAKTIEQAIKDKKQASEKK